MLLLLFGFTVRRFRALPERGWLVGLGVALLLSLNPFFRFTAGRAWNHDLAVLGAVAAFLAFLQAGKSERPWLWLAACGGLVGLATGTRLSLAPLVAPFALATLLFPIRGQRRIFGLTIYGIGVATALLPVALLFWAAPRQFIFDNFTYNGAINLLYRESTVPGEIAFWNKLSFPFQFFLRSPSDVLLIAGFIFFAFRPWWRSGWSGWKSDHQISLLLLTNSLGIVKPSTWPVFSAHEKAEAIATLLPRGRVLTLAPIFPLEAGRQIYPQSRVDPLPGGRLRLSIREAGRLLGSSLRWISTAFSPPTRQLRS